MKRYSLDPKYSSAIAKSISSWIAFSRREIITWTVRNCNSTARPLAASFQISCRWLPHSRGDLRFIGFGFKYTAMYWNIPQYILQTLLACRISSLLYWTSRNNNAEETDWSFSWQISVPFSTYRPEESPVNIRKSRYRYYRWIHNYRLQKHVHLQGESAGF
jgi:hypothetical protein